MILLIEISVIKSLVCINYDDDDDDVADLANLIDDLLINLNIFICYL